MASDITFTVDVEGNVKVAETDVDKVTMIDEYAPHDVVISKTDINGNEIGGAQLKITGRENGAACDITPITWTSVEGENKTVELKAGTYTLHEDAVPNGGRFILASDITFTVDLDGNVKVAETDVDKVTMIDEYAIHDVIISKTGINGNKIGGAYLKITGRESGEETDINPIEFVTEENKTKTFSLKPGTYTLTETKAPEGYITADPIIFTIENNGTVKIGETIVDSVNMADDWTKVNIIKTDAYGTALSGAKLELLKSDGTTSIRKWTSTTSPETFIALPVGTYILREEKAPNGYQWSEDRTITVSNTGTVQIFTIENAKIIAPPTDATTGIWIQLIIMVMTLISIITIVIKKHGDKYNYLA